MIQNADGTRIEGYFQSGRFIPENEIPAPEKVEAPLPKAAAVAQPVTPAKANKKGAESAPVAAREVASAKSPGRSLDNLPDYCRKVAEANHGSYQVEEACLQMARREDESLSRTTIMHMNIPPRIQQYCQTIADASNGSFMAMFSCMQKELAAMERLK